MTASMKFTLLLVIIYGTVIVDAADCGGSKQSVQEWDMWAVRELMCTSECNRQYFCELTGQEGMRIIRFGHTGRHCWDALENIIMQCFHNKRSQFGMWNYDGENYQIHA
ncbi:unnamed protein product [Rotaria sordida]|uniref:Uncharacterized protein n=1 Tax=Rotaria sordida TaxID=392033 RepID=A0A815H745_9BILA|nr:unnamed protein product [Rotaria sordida]CAF1600395.1 unnamed protein product [Rotaria sordida]